MLRLQPRLWLLVLVTATLVAPGAATAAPEYTVVTSLGNAIIPGTTLVPNTDQDDTTAAIAFPFPVKFYGTTYTTANVSTNGNLQFVSNNTANVPRPGCLPDQQLDTAIVPFFADLNANVGGGVVPPGSGTYTATLGSAPNRQFVVEWRTTLFGHEADTRINGEIVFYENSPVISMIYGPSSNAGADEISGIQLGKGSRFVQFSCGTPALVPGLRVDYIPGTVVTGAGAGGGPHVRKFDGAAGTSSLSFFAYNPAFIGGVRVAVGDLNGDGAPDIVTGAGPGGGPQVSAFDGITGAPLPGPGGAFFAYNPGFAGGVFVATARGLIGGGAKVAVFDRSGSVPGAESDNIQASLAALGHSVSTFTDTEFDEVATALAGKDVLVIPPILSDPGSSVNLPSSTAVGRFVSAGGGVIVLASLSVRDTDVLGNLLGVSVLNATSLPGASTKAGGATGTPFAGGPATLADNGAGNMAALGSPLPAGGSAIYTSGGNVTVALFPFGAGRIVYLGWSWNNAQPNGALDGGWLTVLDEAVFAVARSPVIVTGAGPGGGPDVRVFHAADASLLAAFFAYPAGFTGGVRVALGDVNGDGVPDIITAAGPGGGPHVRVLDGITLAEIRSFFAYPAGFTGGVFVGAGDVNGDGKADIITGAGPGGGPHVRVFSGQDGLVLKEFFAYDAAFTGGVAVAAADLNGDGKADIVTGAGPGGGPHVQVFDAVTLAPIQSFFAYSPSFLGGVFVGAQ